jgi:hypothetical protein
LATPVLIGQASSAATPVKDVDLQSKLSKTYGSLPLAFEPRGQEGTGEFVARGNGYGIFLSPAGITLNLNGAAQSGSEGRREATVNIRFPGGNPIPGLQAGERLPGKVNYFFGADPSKWVSNISTYRKVVAPSVYPGIDVLYYGNQSRLEYDFVVAPHADPRRIRLKYEGARKLRIDDDGELVIETAAGSVRQKLPVIYQGSAEKRRLVRGRYVRRGRNEVGFEVSGYDTNDVLVIDPVIVYSTFLGVGNTPMAIAVDNAGNAYVAGTTGGTNFPLVNPLSQDAGATTGSFAFISKFNASGNALVYSTLLGGIVPNGALSVNTQTQATAIAVDAGGNAYFTGNTYSPYFPVTAGAFQGSYGGQFLMDAFVAKLSPDGSHLLYSSYLGGADDDSGQGIAVDSSGNAYVAGWTLSSNFPTASPFQATKHGGTSGFITKINPNGTAKVFSTYIGGSSADRLSAIAVDSSGIYVAGWANSADFPVMNTLQAFQPSFSNTVIAKLDSTGSSLIYSTFLGGSTDNALASAIAVDAAGNAIVTGSTGLGNFPTVNAGALTTGPGFVAKINSTGTAWVYVVRLAGGAASVAVDINGNAYIAGGGSCTLVLALNPLPNSICLPEDPAQANVAVLDPNGVPTFASLLGGSDYDAAAGIAVDPTGNIYVVGSTVSSDFPITGGIGQTFVAREVFVTKISTSVASVRPVSVTPASGTSASGTPQSFAFKFADDNGPSDLNGALVRIGTSPSSGDLTTCSFSYVRSTNRLELVTGAAASVGGILGTSTILQSQQCSIDLGPATALWTGNTLTLTLPISFLPPIAGPNQIWMDAQGASMDSGWFQEGTWTVTAPANIVSAIAVTPSNGIGASQTFTFQFADTSGGDQVQDLWGWITPAFSQTNSANTCKFYFDKRSHQWNLLADDGVTWMRVNFGGLTLLENSQCSIATSAAPQESGNYVTIAVPVTFKNSFNGARQIWMYADDAVSNSGWQQRGNWTVNDVEIVTILTTPYSGGGATFGFDFTASDSDGFNSLQKLWIWFTPSFSSPYGGTCRMYYDRAAARLNLMDDSGIGWSSGVIGTVGAGTLSNSQCSIDLSSSNVILVDKNLALHVSITFPRSYRGVKQIWVNADGLTASSGWQQRGTWTVPPTLVSRL